MTTREDVTARISPGVADGRWRQWYATFIDQLRLTSSVGMAATNTGVHSVDAYKHRIECAEFALQWDDAITKKSRALILEERAMHRAIYGWSHPIFHAGVCVGHKEMFDHGLTIFFLKHWMPEKYMLESAIGASGAHEDTAQALIDARKRIEEHMATLDPHNGNGANRLN